MPAGAGRTLHTDMPLFKQPFSSLFRRPAQFFADLPENEDTQSLNRDLNKLVRSVRKSAERKVRNRATRTTLSTGLDCLVIVGRDAIFCDPLCAIYCRKAKSVREVLLSIVNSFII